MYSKDETNCTDSYKNNYSVLANKYDLQTYGSCVNDILSAKDSETVYELDPYIARCLKIFTNCFLINVICLFGVVGNCLNLAVLRQHGFKETTNMVLISLSTSDLTFCFFVPISRLQCIVSHTDEALSVSVHTFATLITFMPKYVYLTTSVCYVVVIAVERFTAVYFPFHVAKIFRKNVTVSLLVILPTVCTVSMVPSFITLTYDWVYDPRFNQTVAVLKYTDFYITNKDLIDVYIWVGLNNFYCATSITIVTTCCVAIGVKVTQAKMKRMAMTKKATGYDAKVVKMLMTVCVVYLTLMIPTITLYSYVKPNFIITSPLASMADDFGVILHSINASMNFLVYVTMSEKFAATYRKLLCSRGESRMQGGSKVRRSV